MKIRDIVVHAACNSAVVPSFNTQEIPGDIYDIGVHKLVHEILPLINVDRTLDMALTSRVFQPKGNKIRLVRDPLDIVTDERILEKGELRIDGEIWGMLNNNQLKDRYNFVVTKVPYNSNRFPPNTDYWTSGNWIPPYPSDIQLQEYMPDGLLYIYQKYTNGVPSGQYFANIDKAIWCFETTDNELFMCIQQQRLFTHSVAIVRRVGTNIRTMPYFVDSVLDEPSGLPYTYLDQSQFHSIDYKFIPWIYTQENGDDWLELEFKNTGNVAKRLTMPIPIHLNGEDIIAPPKFYQYLVDYLAEQYAIHYGMSTLPTMQEQKRTSYGVLKRQHPNTMQPMNTRMRIRNTLQSGQSRWWRFDGFN